MAQRSAAAPVAAAKAPVPASTKAVQPAASTRQAGAAAVSLGGETAPGVLDLKAMGAKFAPPEPLAAWLEGHRKSQLQARFGAMAQGPIEVETQGKGRYQVRHQRLPLNHPLFARLGEAAPALAPCLVIDVEGDKIKGHVGLAAGAKLDSFESQLGRMPAILGLAGFQLPSLSNVTNKLEGGRLKLGLSGVPINLGQAFNGKLSLLAEDDAITSFEASVAVTVGGLANGTLELQRAADGLVTGKATVAVQLPKNFSGSVDVSWDGRAVNGEGKVGYKGEKLSGEVTLRLMEKSLALQLEAQKKAPPDAAPPAPTPIAAAPSSKTVNYVLFGEGDLAFAFNTWLNGTAHVIVDPKGYVTLIGKITPQREFELFPQKDYVRQLFKIEVRATYGLPVVGNIFIFANVSMDAFAKIGPAKFYKIIVQGTYSTDPAKCQDFSVQGTFNMSAAAGARLRGEAGAGLEILGHDIKAGAGVNGIAGIKGYAEATPIIGYREKAAPGEDKKGEWFIRGDVEVVGQPFLALSGDLFVEVDAPWWSPISDDRWTWPLGGKEWPLGGPLGIGASVDYVFGSSESPKLDFKPVEFSPDKFMTDLYSDKAKPGKGAEVDKPGTWKEKNSANAAAPPKASPKGNAAPGKAPTLAAAKPKVKPGGGKKGGKSVDPNARTANGKSVKQLQDDATKKDKKGTTKKEKTEALTFPEKTFKEGDKQHKLWVRSEGGNFVPMISSTPQHLEDFLNAAEKKSLPKKNKDKIPEARRLLASLGKALSKAAGSNVKQLKADVQAAEEALSKVLHDLLDGVSITQLKEIYKLEGLVASYKNMPTQKSDSLTPDHQPQAQLLVEVAKLPFFKNTRLQDAAGGGHADGALTINLHKIRHYAGRTYGRSNLVPPVIASIKADAGAGGLELKDKRAIAIKQIRNQTGLDVKAIRDEVLLKSEDSKAFRDVHDDKKPTADQKALIQKIKDQVQAGEDRILKQDLDQYAKDV